MFLFTNDRLKDLNILKQALISTLIIQPADWSLSFEIMCDASNYVVGVVLGQRKDRKLHAIYYANKTLNPAQMYYVTTRKELLAVVFVIKKFRFYLLGLNVISTDHTTLRYLMTIKEFKPPLVR